MVETSKIGKFFFLHRKITLSDLSTFLSIHKPIIFVDINIYVYIYINLTIYLSIFQCSDDTGFVRLRYNICRSIDF